MTGKIMAAMLAAVIIVNPAGSMEWEVDLNHSTVGFAVKHLLLQTIRGQFTKYSARVVFDPAKPGEFVGEAVIETASITTSNEKRDDHLRTPDFFDAANFPSIIYRARRVEPQGEGRYRVIGDLTIRGITREVPLDVVGFNALLKTPWGQEVAFVSMRGVIDRRDFNVGSSTPLEGGGAVVSTDVMLEIDLELNKKEQD